MSNPYGQTPSGGASGAGDEPGFSSYPQQSQSTPEAGAQQPYPGGYQQFPGGVDDDPTAGAPERPGAWMRFLAYFIDTIVVSVISLIIDYVLFGSQYSEWTDQLREAVEADTTAPPFPTSIIYGGAAVMFVIWFLYRAGMEAGAGGSLGRFITGQRVVTLEGGKVSFGTALIRNSWYLINAIVALIPFVGYFASIVVPIVVGVTIARSPLNQSFSDKWAKAQVVKK
ncbi:RDD family protein [Corynebacterium bovis]|uniref:RDD family protein n=1 Tax=Corynebacterium bovis TaxID=36808 RepID=UPI002446935C|nr:RDD family protein [Corynebacterium bovis]MDH2455458.1 RDD family protein [Corynebacterium bovis]